MDFIFQLTGLMLRPKRQRQVEKKEEGPVRKDSPGGFHKSQFSSAARVYRKVLFMSERDRVCVCPVFTHTAAAAVNCAPAFLKHLLDVPSHVCVCVCVLLLQ